MFGSFELSIGQRIPRRYGIALRLMLKRRFEASLADALRHSRRSHPKNGIKMSALCGST
jgi:hypothetical protein